MENINGAIIETAEELMEEVTITELPVEKVVSSGNVLGTLTKVGICAGLLTAAVIGGKWVYGKVTSKKNASEEGEVTTEESAEDEFEDEEN